MAQSYLPQIRTHPEIERGVVSMIRLTDRTAIPAPPDRVWEWFATLDAAYCDWHPEHIQWKTLKGKQLERGTVAFADEWIGRSRLTGRFRITEAVPGRF